jgi:prevent-host-death family protein
MRDAHLDPQPLLGGEPTEVGTCAARSRLDELIAAVERGESFVITRHGRPVARLLPTEPPAARGALVAAFREARAGCTLDVPLAELIAEGRG